MDYTKFQVAVVEIAHEGTPLTVANVVARLHMEPEKAERLLDKMAKEGRLDLEVDETEGVVIYRVRGLTERTMSERIEALTKSTSSSAIEHVGTAIAFGKPFHSGPGLPPSLRRSIPMGALLGGVLPGVGLAYSAPWPVVVVATIGAVLAFKLAGFLWFIGIPVFLAGVLASALAGGLYAWRYNQAGRRAALLPAEDSPRLLR